MKVADLGCLSAPDRLRQHKRIIREAGLIARDEASVSLSADPENLVSLYATISRAVWYNDRRVYNLLISRYDLACKHLTLVDGAVTLLAPSLFNDEYNSQKVAASHNARDRLDAMVNSNRTSLRQRRKAKVDSQSLERQLELWHPFGQRLRLSGVKAGGGIIRDPAKCLTALSSFWSRTFAHRDIDMDQAKDYVATHMSRFVFHTVAPLAKRDFRRLLARVPHS